MRSDHASRSKKWGVCVYYKKHIPLVRRDDLCILSSGLVPEICLENEKCFLTCIYWSTNQIQHEFENFCTSLDTLMDHVSNKLPICSVITGDLNARCSKWCNKDITNSVGREIDTLISSAVHNQIISKPTDIVSN